MHVALVGPCSPSDVSRLLDAPDESKAIRLLGYRGTAVSELAKGLVRAGHEVTVVTTDTSILSDAVEFSGPNFRIVVQRSRARPRNYLRDLYALERQKMAEVLLSIQADIVHAHWTYEFELAAQDSKLLHVTTARDSPVTILLLTRDRYRAARLLVAARARPGIRNLTTVSPYMAQCWRKQMWYRGAITVIPNSVPVFANRLVRQPTAHPSILDVTSSGRLKNVVGLLRAFARVKGGVPQAELRVAGPGLSANEPLSSWAQSNGLSDGVSFLGPLTRADLAQEYSRAWLFAHASREESFGLSALEALSFGLPVVGGRASGGIPYVLNEGRAGWLTDVKDPEVFAQSMQSLIADGPRAQPSGTSRFLLENFSPSVVAQRYLDLYESVLAGEMRRG